MSQVHCFVHCGIPCPHCAPAAKYYVGTSTSKQRYCRCDVSSHKLWSTSILRTASYRQADVDTHVVAFSGSRPLV